uniref:Uncharacterized protein n=1 Tax=Caenorhabditis japonica TaxID=281687 RepID=A0A8R1ITL1_CAEJA
MKRERKEMPIRKTVSLTTKMRAERGGPEQLETSVMSMEATATSDSSESARSSLESKTPKTRQVRVQTEKMVNVNMELVSDCERSCDTRSMNTISLIENMDEFEKKCEVIQGLRLQESAFEHSLRCCFPVHGLRARGLSFDSPLSDNIPALIGRRER